MRIFQITIMYIGFPRKQVLLGCVRVTEEIEPDGTDLSITGTTLLTQFAVELRSDLGFPTSSATLCPQHHTSA